MTKIVLVLISSLIQMAFFPASADESTEDEWLGIEGLQIVDVHHTEGYIVGMMNLSGENGTGWIEPGEYQTPQGQPSPEIAGVWSIFLAGEVAEQLDLTLYQADGEVFGEGTTTSKGGSRRITAAGYAVFGLLDLRVVVLGDPALYRLRLSLLASPAQGSYVSYSASGLMGSGIASGYKTAPLDGLSGSVQAEDLLPPDLAGAYVAGQVAS